MDPAVQAFRTEYRASIAPWYNGWVHGAFIFGVSGGGMVYSMLQVAEGGGGWSWLSVLPAFLFANFGEWWLHKHALHRRIPALKALWQRHTVQHHHYFTSAHMTVSSHREYRIIFFPPYAVLGIALIHAGLGALWALPFGAAAGWAWMAGGMSHYLMYETLHTAAHLHERRWLRHLPLVNTMRRNHWLHHHPALMSEYNMNLTLPIADWALRSSDLQRGLLGTLFNGYRMDRLRPELRVKLGRSEEQFPPAP
jgi:hypothetical protein